MTLRAPVDMIWQTPGGVHIGFLLSLAVSVPGEGAGFVRAVQLDVHEHPALEGEDLVVDATPRDGAWRCAMKQGAKTVATARLDMRTAADRAVTSIAPPDIAGPEAYAVFTPPPGAMPPLSSRLEFRPTMQPDGSTVRPGWDAVWVKPRATLESLAETLCLMVEAWIPSVLHQSIVTRLRDASPTLTPGVAPTVAVSATLPGADAAYRTWAREGVVMLTRPTAVMADLLVEDGEIWTQDAELLLVWRSLRQLAAFRVEDLDGAVTP